MPEHVQGASPFFVPTVPLLEHWKPMPDFEDSYEISCVGNARRTKVGRGTKAGILALNLNRKIGYYYVYPSKGAKNYTRRVNVLVAKAFHGAPPGMVSDHINGNKLKNWASNLEYVKQSTNISRAIALGLCEKNFAIARSRSPLDEEGVRNVRFMANFISFAKIARQYRMNPNSIRAIVLRITWKHVA